MNSQGKSGAIYRTPMAAVIATNRPKATKGKTQGGASFGGSLNILMNAATTSTMPLMKSQAHWIGSKFRVFSITLLYHRTRNLWQTPKYSPNLLKGLGINVGSTTG